jgi:hypothetical protein
MPARRRLIVAAGLLAAGMVSWAALPLGGVSGFAKPMLAVASCCALLSVLSLAGVGTSAEDRDREHGLELIDWPGLQWWRWLVGLPSALPWTQLLIVTVLVLEALHPARPWHTAVLGTVLLGYLLAFHLAESAAGPAVLRPHLPLIIAGASLTWIAVAAITLPVGHASASSGWIAVLAAIAAVVVAGLALPVRS